MSDQYNNALDKARAMTESMRKMRLRREAKAASLASATSLESTTSLESATSTASVSELRTLTRVTLRSRSPTPLLSDKPGGQRKFMRGDSVFEIEEVGNQKHQNNISNTSRDACANAIGVKEET
jgi:hypothetical protein